MGLCVMGGALGCGDDSGPAAERTQRGSVSADGVARALAKEADAAGAGCGAAGPIAARRFGGPRAGRTFECAVRRGGRTDRYVVEVQSNGSFVAEPLSPAGAIYGCCVRRSR